DGELAQHGHLFNLRWANAGQKRGLPRSPCDSLPKEIGQGIRFSALHERMVCGQELFSVPFKIEQMHLDIHTHSKHPSQTEIIRNDKCYLIEPAGLVRSSLERAK